MGRKTVGISKRALISRINRKLRHGDEALRKSRGMQSFLNVGDYWILDLRRNYVVGKDIDLEELATKLGVLGEAEGLQE